MTPSISVPVDERRGDVRGQADVVAVQRDVGVETAPVGRVPDPVEQVRGRGLTGDAVALGLVPGLLHDRVELDGVQLLRLGDRIRHEHPTGGAEITLDGQHLGDVFGRVDAGVDGMTRIDDVEARVPVRAVPEHRHAQRLEPFQGRRDVEDGLGPGADQHERIPGQGHQIGRLVEGLGGAVVHPAEASRGEDVDARGSGEESRPRDGGTRAPAGDGRERQFADAGLEHGIVLRQLLDLGLVQSDRRHTPMHANGRRDSSRVADELLAVIGHFDVARTRQAVGEDRGFQRDDRLSGFQGLGNVGTDPQR